MENLDDFLDSVKKRMGEFYIETGKIEATHIMMGEETFRMLCEAGEVVDDVLLGLIIEIADINGGNFILYNRAHNLAVATSMVWGGGFGA